MTIPSSRERALQVLCMADPAQKAAQTRALFAAIAQLPADADAILVEPDALPGRPALPRLVPPKDVPTRSPFTLEGKAALLHAIAHIEFNAIKYELDHIVPLAVGGHPRNLKNLMLQPWDGEDGAKKKDRLEKRLQQLVCSRQHGLRDAQAAIYGDW